MSNFAPYQSRVQLAAPEQHYNKPANLHYDNPGERALARTNADTVGVIVKGYNDWKEQYDSGKVMEANNEYNRLMSEGTAELMQRKQENALNIVDDYDKLHQKALDKVRKKFGAFISYGKAGQAFNIYTERDNNTRRNNMMKYQLAETEAYHETQFNNQLSSCQKLAADGGYTDVSIDEGMNRADGFIAQRYAPYGKEMIEQQKRIFKGEIVSGALSLAMKMEDYPRMGQIALKYSDFLDPKTRVSVLSMMGKRQKDAHDFKQANDLWVQLGGENATLDDYRNYFKNMYSNKGDATTRFSHYDSRLGLTMPNGRNGCVEAFMRLTAPFFSFSEENKGEVNVGSVCRLAQNSSNASIERYRGGAIPEGCGIIYFSEGDDISNFDNAEHITMSDGSGGFYGNSSSAKDYEDENGNYVRGDGCIIHSDEQDIGGYQIGYIIRMDKQTMQEMTDLEAEEQAQKAWAVHQKKITEMKAANNFVISQAQDEMDDLMNHGVEDVEQYRAIVNKYAYANGTVNNHVRIQLEKTVAAIERRNEKATEQGARRQPSGKVSEADKNFLRAELTKGDVTETQILDYCTEKGITSNEEINKLLKIQKEYMENKGEFAIDYDYIEDRCGIDIKHFPNKEYFEKAIKKVAQWEYKVMRAESNGRLQDGWEDALAKRVRDDMTNYVVGGTYTDKGTWFNTKEETKIPIRTLISNGFRPEWDQTGDDGYILYTQDGQAVYKTGAEIRNMVDRFGYIE